MQRKFSRSSVVTTTYDEGLTDAYGVLFTESSPFNWLSRILQRYAINRLPLQTDVSVLDVACGIGAFCRDAAALGYRDVVGVDISPSQIEACKRLSDTSDRCTFVVADARHIARLDGFEQRFDVINASWLYDTAADLTDAIEMATAIRRCLKLGGRHQGMEINFGIKASEPHELDDFGIALMLDQPAGTRPINKQRVRAEIAVTCADIHRRGPKTIQTDVTFFDEATLKLILQEAGFMNINFEHPKRWLENLHWDSAAEREKFVRYVETNPEMIGFSAQ